MALRCSVLGHAWDEPEVEREHEDRGAEAVVTVREFRACKRCGDRDVLSEVTEVKPAESATESTPAESAPGGTPAEGANDGSADAPGDAEIDDDPADAHREAQTDDGVILGSDGDRDPREWPDPGLPEKDDVDYEPRPWPEVESPDPVEREPRDPGPFEAATPTSERGGEPVDPAEALSEAASEQNADPGDEPEEEIPLEGVEVFCPSCGFVDERPTPSLRGGDSCPECRDRYLEERDSQE